MDKAGRKDQPITLQRLSRTPDGIGGSTKDWADFSETPSVWAHVQAGSGSEALEEGRMAATAFATFTIYNRSDVTDLDRIIWGGVAYNIRSIRREGEQSLDLAIDAERGGAS